MAKGPKKSKAQLEEERLQAEEEARKAKLAEDKRLAEEAERKRIEDLRIKEERRVFREGELKRLLEEQNAGEDEDETRRLQLQAEEKIQHDREEWECFVNPVQEFGTANEKDLNTFLSSVEDSIEIDFEEVFSVVKTIQKVCRGTEDRWTDNYYNQCMSDLAITEEGIKKCCDLIFKKLDGATVQTLRFIENHIAGSDRQELLIDAWSKGICMGMWGSFADIRPVRKSVIFEKLGVQIDVPKQILQHDAGFVFRVFRIQNDFLSISAYCPSMKNSNTDHSKYIVGDLIILDIIKPPPRAQTLRAKKWTIRDKSSTSLCVQRSTYPSSVSSKFLIRVPDEIKMSEDITIAVWDEKEMSWSENGIADYQYSEATRQVQFNCSTVGIFALVRKREADFPYKSWTLCPLRNLQTQTRDDNESSARFSIKTVSADIVIDIVGTQSKLVQPNTKYLTDLVGVKMPCGILLRQLQQRGYNLMPTVSKEAAKKDYNLEMAVLKQIARCSSSFEFEGSPEWNSTLGDEQSPQLGIHLRESTAFVGGLDVFNYECMLAELDSLSQSMKHSPEVGKLRPPGVKFSLVLGDEYGSKSSYSQALRPHEVSHMSIAASMSNRCTPETSQRIVDQNVRFEKTIFQFLRIIRPFSCS